LKPHNLVISFIGACLLWVGWFGFNAGSALGHRGWPQRICGDPLSARRRQTLGWVLAEWMLAASRAFWAMGCVAGLVAITPASGFVQPFPALLIGFCAGLVCYFAGGAREFKFGYDDSLGCVRRTAGGTLGALLTGVFATSAVNASFDSAGKKMALGLVDGHAGQIGNQALGCLFSPGSWQSWVR
jgi:Amt family ammonium transporter